MISSYKKFFFTLYKVQNVEINGNEEVQENADTAGSFLMMHDIEVDDNQEFQASTDTSFIPIPVQNIEINGNVKVQASTATDGGLLLMQNNEVNSNQEVQAYTDAPDVLPVQIQKTDDIQEVQANTNTHDVSLPLSSVKLPSKMKVSGRPKGAGQTALGLPKRKVKLNGPIPFHQKTPDQKDKCMLSWLVKHKAQDIISYETLLEPHNLKKARNISNAIRDESILLARIRSYFTEEGWTEVLKLKKQVERISWLCNVCHSDLNDRQVACDSCLEWLHLQCAGLKNFPRKKKMVLSNLLFENIVFYKKKDARYCSKNIEHSFTLNIYYILISNNF